MKKRKKKLEIRDSNLWEGKRNIETGFYEYLFKKVKIFSVRNSRIEGAGWGLFSEIKFKVNKEENIFYYEGVTIAKKKKKLIFDEEFRNEVIKLKKNDQVNIDQFEDWINSPNGNYVMEIYERKNEKKYINGKFQCFNGTKFINDSKKKKWR